MVGVEDLREKDPQGNQGGKQAVAESDLLVADRLLGQVAIQEPGKRELPLLGELLLALSDLATPA